VSKVLSFHRIFDTLIEVEAGSGHIVTGASWGNNKLTHHIPCMVPKYIRPLPIVCAASNVDMNAQYR